MRAAGVEMLRQVCEHGWTLRVFRRRGVAAVET